MPTHKKLKFGEDASFNFQSPLDHLVLLTLEDKHGCNVKIAQEAAAVLLVPVTKEIRQQVRRAGSW